MGKQAQLSRKKGISSETKDGEAIEINVAVLLLSYSRLRIFRLSISKFLPVLLSFLTETFEAVGGVPDELLTDNMKTVMDEVRTAYFEGRVNVKFKQFVDVLDLK